MNLFNLFIPGDPAVPILANLPHSGLVVPEPIAAQLLPEYRAVLPNCDWHLDRLYDFLPRLGITMLQATHSRYVVDLNRRLREPLFGNFWTSVIPESTAFGKPIYQTVPTSQDIYQRIERFYKPYHEKLEAMLRAMRDRFGKVYLLDLHSYGGIISDDVCLGNENHSTCSEHLIATVEQAFRQQKYQVVRNKVFTGGWITRHYGQLPNVETLQIEIHYPVYLQKIDPLQQPAADVPELVEAKLRFQQVFKTIVEQL